MTHTAPAQETCPNRLYKRLNCQWNELFFWVEYRVPRNLWMTIKCSMRLLGLALSLAWILFLTLLLPIRAIPVKSWLESISKSYIKFVYRDWDQ